MKHQYVLLKYSLGLFLFVFILNFNTSKSYALTVGSSEDQADIRACLSKLESVPFKTNSKGLYEFETINTSVRILGMGNHEITDNKKTDKPVIVLIRPSVNVLTGTTFVLNNPNAWYCFKSEVNVLSKMEIHINKKAHLASTNDQVTVLGSTDKKAASEMGGVTVLGKTKVKFID